MCTEFLVFWFIPKDDVSLYFEIEKILTSHDSIFYLTAVYTNDTTTGNEFQRAHPPHNPQKFLRFHLLHGLAWKNIKITKWIIVRKYRSWFRARLKDVWRSEREECKKFHCWKPNAENVSSLEKASVKVNRFCRFTTEEIELKFQHKLQRTVKDNNSVHFVRCKLSIFDVSRPAPSTWSICSSADWVGWWLRPNLDQ